jgi:thioredoxin 2
MELEESMADTGAGTGATTAAKHLTLRCQFCETCNRIAAARAADRPKCGKCGKPMLLDRPFALNEETFARTIEGAEVPVLVDFYADWCGPCKVMAPAVDEIAATYQGRALVAKLDTDRAQQTSSSFNIRGIPTTIVFKGGKEVARQTGAVPKPLLAKMLDGAL